MQALVKQLDGRQQEAASATRRCQELQEANEQQRKEMQQLCAQLAQLREENCQLKVTMQCREPHGCGPAYSFVACQVAAPCIVAAILIEQGARDVYMACTTARAGSVTLMNACCLVTGGRRAAGHEAAAEAAEAAAG